jgi:hypothetical protein
MSERELEKLIDEALTGYVPQPRAGIAERVLARVDHRGRGVVLSLAAAVAATVALMFLMMPRPVEKSAPIRVATNLPKHAPSVDHPPQSERAPRIRRTASQPKREIFPSPRPLSDEARLLVAMVRKSPEQAERLLTFKEPEPIKPLLIEEIEIEPLEGETE